MRILATLLIVTLAGCGNTARPTGAGDRDCVEDADCALQPSQINCCGECPPAPPFQVGTREDLDAIVIENEQRCAESTKECVAPVCDPMPKGCWAKAACTAGRCVVETDGCR